jgi:hypothetical protein
MGYSVNIWGFITLYHLLQHSPQGLIHCPGNTHCLMPVQKKSGLIAHTGTPKLSPYCLRSVLFHWFPMARDWRMWLLGNVLPPANMMHLFSPGWPGICVPLKITFYILHDVEVCPEGKHFCHDVLQGEAHHLVKTVSPWFFFMQTKHGTLLGQRS